MRDNRSHMCPDGLQKSLMTDCSWVAMVLLLAMGLGCNTGNDRFGLTPDGCPTDPIAIGETVQLSVTPLFIDDQVSIVVWTGGTDAGKFELPEGDVIRVDGEQSVTFRGIEDGEVTVSVSGTVIKDTGSFSLGGSNIQFGGTCEIQIGDGIGSDGAGNGGMTDSGDSGDCNPECGFDDAAPDGMKAAAVCDITIPDGTFQGSSTDDDFCENDADCDDGDPCTTNTCVGAVVKVCQSTEVTDCGSTNLMLSNGDELIVTFDRTLLSATVNGLPAADGDSNKTITWIAEGLSSGEQTLLIEWQNREGANPPEGCHEIDVVVP